MKKLFLGTLLLALVIAVPVPTMARVSVGINIGLPPLVFAAPPPVIALPDTAGVYVVPDIAEDLYFWNGYWWRLWDGRWYSSHYYDRGWGYYNRVPSFYFDVDPGWRGYYRDRDWHGHRWDYDVIPQRRLQSNWRNWDTNRHWERHGTWGVRDYQPRPRNERRELRQQRQQQYQRNTDVQRTVQPRGHQSHQPQDRQQVQPRVRQQQQPRDQQRQDRQQMQPRNQQRQDRQQMQPRVRQQQQSTPQQGRPARGEEDNRGSR